MAKRDLNGATVVITGGAGGIGAALGHSFVSQGAQVALLDLNAESATKAADALDGTAIGLRCDVTDERSVMEALAEVSARLGPIDVLVNNAGISHRSLLQDTEVSVIRRVMDVNFFGAVNCTRHALDDLVARKGAVIAISSIAGFAPLVGRCGYSASKHALHGFFDSLRAEVGQDGVDVLLVCPAYTDTGIDRNALGGGGGSAKLSKSTVGKVATPESVAEAVVSAVTRRKRQLVLSPIGKAAFWMTRVAPRLYEPLMKRSTRDDFE